MSFGAHPVIVGDGRVWHIWFSVLIYPATDIFSIRICLASADHITLTVVVDRAHLNRR